MRAWCGGRPLWSWSQDRTGDADRTRSSTRKRRVSPYAVLAAATVAAGVATAGPLSPPPLVLPAPHLDGLGLDLDLEAADVGEDSDELGLDLGQDPVGGGGG